MLSEKRRGSSGGKAKAKVEKRPNKAARDVEETAVNNKNLRRKRMIHILSNTNQNIQLYKPISQ